MNKQGIPKALIFSSVVFLVLTLFSCKNNQADSIAVIAEVEESTFSSPVLGGDYPDSSTVRVGKDYYMKHSSFNYCIGLMVWHYTDLVNF